MDPNASTTIIDKILQNPQNWISFLTLTFTIVIGLSGALSVIIGLFTAKRFWELRQQHFDITKEIQTEKSRLQKICEEYNFLKDMLLQVAFEPDLCKNQELLDACIQSLEKNKMLQEGSLDVIVSAMYYVSERGTIKDAMRLIKIFKLATKLGIKELSSSASTAFNRMKLDISKNIREDHEKNDNKSMGHP